MQKSLTRLFTAVLMAALLVSASIMSVSAADHGEHAEADGWRPITEATTIETSGSYVLANDVNGIITVSAADVTICLNGYNITSTAAKTITMSTGATLTLCNCGTADSTHGVVKTEVTSYATSNVAIMCTGKGTEVTIKDGVTVKSANSAAIRVSSNGTLNLEGGTIDGGIVGIIIPGSAGTVNMSGGTVYATPALSGTNPRGGFYLNNASANVVMTGGTITGEGVTNGQRGVAVNQGTFTLNGGTIENCTTDGIYMNSASDTVNLMSGTITGCGYSVQSKATAAATITISGGSYADALNLGASATVSITGGKFVSSNNSKATIENHIDPANYEVKTISEDPYDLEVVEVDCSTNPGVHGSGWTQIGGEGGQEKALIEEPGRYFLGGDLTGAANRGNEKSGVIYVNATGKVTLCLNGYSVTPDTATDGAALYIIKGNVTLCNCSQTESVLHVGKTRTVCVGNQSGGQRAVKSLTVNSDKIKFTADSAKKAAIELFYDGLLTLNAGTVTGSATAAVQCKGGNVVMNGGTITGNTGVGVEASHGGTNSELNANQASTVTMTGGTITNNAGGVKLVAGTFTMKGDATITDNNAAEGAAVYVGSKSGTWEVKTDGVVTDSGDFSHVGTFTMEGGTISGNTATVAGGGVYVTGTGEFTMNNGTISKNTAPYGAGVHVNNDASVFTMDGGEISENIVTGTANGGSVCQFAKSKFTMNGGSVIDNVKSDTCTTHAGVHTGNNATFIMNGGEIKGNATRGIDAGKELTITGGSVADKIVFDSATTKISGGIFGADNDRNTLGYYVVGADGEREDLLAMTENTDEATKAEGYAWMVGRGLYSVENFMDFKSSLSLSLYVGNLDAFEKSWTVTAASDTKEYEVSKENVPDLPAIITIMDIAAKELQDKITVTVADGDFVLMEKTISVYDVAKEWWDVDSAASAALDKKITEAQGEIEKAEGDETIIAAQEALIAGYEAEKVPLEASKNMFEDVINYGNAAQKLFLGTTGKVIGNGSVDPEWTADTENHGWDGEEGAVAVSLNLKERIELNVYVNKANASANATLNGTAITVTDTTKTKDAGKYTRLTIDTIDVVNAKGELVIEIADCGTLTYSIVDYVASNTDEKYVDLMTALSKYVESVINVLGANQ